MDAVAMVFVGVNEATTKAAIEAAYPGEPYTVQWGALGEGLPNCIRLASGQPADAVKLYEALKHLKGGSEPEPVKKKK